MKKLMMTTALVAVTSFGAVAQTAPETTQPQSGQAMMVPAFLASEFTGMTLYSLDSEAVRALREAPAAQDDALVGWDARIARWTSSDVFTAERDAWENVGAINDIVMTQDGDIRGILVDIGGFLGFGTHTVLIDLDDLYFVADETTPEDITDYFVVASLSRDQLEALPEWSEDQLDTGFAPRMSMAGTEAAAYDETAGATGSSVPPAATLSDSDSAAVDEGRIGAPGTPAEAPEGYVMVDAATPTADQLLGADVYDAMGDSVGDVDDLVLATDGAVAEMIVDIGGFLGIGSHNVALPAENIDILWNAEEESVRVHLPMTREQLETLPEYQG